MLKMQDTTDFEENADTYENVVHQNVVPVCACAWVSGEIKAIITNHNIVSVADLFENAEEFVFVEKSDKADIMLTWDDNQVKNLTCLNNLIYFLNLFNLFIYQIFFLQFIIYIYIFTFLTNIFIIFFLNYYFYNLLNTKYQFSNFI